MITSKRPDDTLELLSPDFQRRYEPNFHWKSIVSNHMMLSQLRGLWTGAQPYHTTASRLRDISSQAHHLTETTGAGFIRFGYESDKLTPFVRFLGGASAQRCALADAGAADWADVTGTEGYIFTSQTGLTLGLWMKVWTGTPGAQETYISKMGASGNYSYRIRKSNADVFEFQISTDGINFTTVTSSISETDRMWYLVIGRWDQGTGDMDIWVNGTRNTNPATGIASVFDGNGPFQISGFNGNNGIPVNWYYSIGFLCAGSVGTHFIESLWHNTRSMYGV